MLLLDEPTASLTPHETVALFALLRKLRDDGVSIVFVSHKLEEVQEICDTVTVLRDGRNACDSRSMAGLGRQDLVRLMIGRSEQIPDWRRRDDESTPRPCSSCAIVATALGHSGHRPDVAQGRDRRPLRSGRRRPDRARQMRAGLESADRRRGSNRWPDEPSSAASPRRSTRYRIGYVSEDRKQEGLILMHIGARQCRDHDLAKRVAGRLGLLTDRAVSDGRRAASSQSSRFVRPRSAQIVGNLSGGNQQKISVAKWLAAGVRILIVDEPTVGIDIKTKAYLHELLRGLSEEGTAILLITSDMPEMITLADRIVVMDGYRIKGAITNDRDYERMSREIMGLIHD